MKRRNFLSLIGAAAAAPALPSLGAASAATATAAYNRYQYGLAVFHARSRANLAVGDLATHLRVSSVQARAMMGEMSASGILTRGGTASLPHARRSPYVRRALRQIADACSDQDATQNVRADCAQDVHADHIPSKQVAATATAPADPTKGVH